MRKFLINLDRSADRLALFQVRNRHIEDIERSPGIDGQALSDRDVVANGIAVDGHRFSKGAMGSAISHMTLWEQAILLDDPITIIEDDAILSTTFDKKAQSASSSKKNGDFISWGWNFDAPLFVNLIPNVTRAKIQVSQDRLRENIISFQDADLDVNFIPLVHQFGIPCYSISPQGALKLLDFCKSIKVGSRTLDEAMGSFYRSTNAYVSVPPIAVSENFGEDSLNVDG